MDGRPASRLRRRGSRLAVNQKKAETVRHIIRRYANFGSVRILQEQLDAASIVSKREDTHYGRKPTAPTRRTGGPAVIGVW